MDRGRKSQGCTTACSCLSERDGKAQREGSPKQACSCWFARHCCLVIVARSPFRGGGALPPPYCIYLTSFFVSFIVELDAPLHFCLFFSRHAFQQLSNCVPIPCFFFASFSILFFRVYLIWIGLLLLLFFPCFRMGFHYVTTGWISDVDLRENSVRVALFTLLRESWYIEK